jgi:predicted transcriptional regulator
MIKHMPRASTVNPIKRLRWLVNFYHSQQAAASSLGISPSYFSDLLHGKRDCSERVLDKLALQRVIIQRPGAPRRGR